MTVLSGQQMAAETGEEAHPEEQQLKNLWFGNWIDRAQFELNGGHIIDTGLFNGRYSIHGAIITPKA